MTEQQILIGIFLVILVLLYTQCVHQLGLKFNAAYILAYTMYFDMFGYFYKQYLGGEALLLLVALPLIPVMIAFMNRSSLSQKDSYTGLLLWAAFLSYSLLSLAWSAADSAGLRKEQILLVRGMIPALYTYILYRKYGRFSWSPVALFGLIYAIVHLALGEYNAEFPGRLTLPGGNPIYNARISLITVTICLWAKSIPLPLRIAAIAAATTSALYTQSRGPLVAFAIANLVILFIVMWRKYRLLKATERKKLSFMMGLVLASLAAVLWIYREPIQEMVGESRFTVLFDANRLQGDDNFVGRMALQQHAFQLLEEHPLIGAGLGAASPPLARDFPHNVLIEIAGELGLTGVALWILAILYSFLAARGNPLVRVLLLQTIGYSLISGDFGYNYEYLYISVLAIALQSSRAGKGERSIEQNSVRHYRIGLWRGRESSSPAVQGSPE